MSSGRLTECLKYPSGKINVKAGDKSTFTISFGQSRVSIDIYNVSFFGMSEDNDEDFGILDKIKTAKEIAQILDDHDLTVTILRKGKKVITLGKEAKPTISRLVTGSDDIQIENLTQAIKLGKGISDANQSKE
jgi:hypothetical protein